MEYQSYNPSNSNIYINHRDKVTPVRFKYNNREDVEKVVRKTLTSFWFLYNMMMLLLFMIFYAIYYIILSFRNNSSETVNYSKYFFLIVLIVVSYLFLIPYLAAKLLCKSKKFVLLMPEINRIVNLLPFGKHYYKNIKNLNSKIFKIDVFDNVFLNYNVTGEFSKYLLKVEIIENKINIMKINFFSRKKSYEKNGYSATFYFSRIPETGELKVWYL